jgi:hypothetical protein
VPILNICVTGGQGESERRDYTLLANALAQLNSKTSGVKVMIFQRVEIAPSEFKAANVSHLVEVKHEPGYKEFHEAISRCHIILPLVGPVGSGASYFEAKKRLTGSLPIAVAHKIPSVVHTALAEVYHAFFSAPVTVYNDSETFITALAAMIDDVRGSST